MKNKNAFEMAIGTIVVMVLAIALLVALFFLLKTQFGFFNDNLNVVQEKSNVDAVINSCNSLVTGEQVYSYCCEKKNIQTGNEEFELSCNELKDKDFVSGRIQGLECAFNCSA